MFCKFCGKNIPDTSITCPSCGKHLNEVQPAMPQVQIIGVQTPKSLGLGLALSFLFGPLGLLYSSVKYACILIAINIILGLVSCGSMIGGANAGHDAGMGMAMFGGLLFWIVVPASWIGSMILSWHAITQYNDNVRKGKINRDID